jgi:short-subunit dehydrogenase
LIRLNVLSPIVLTKYVVRPMIADGAGRIVNISIIASTGYNGLSVYAASKAASGGFPRSLAREGGRLGITVNAIAPGFVDTELTKSLDDDRRQRIAGRSALRRLPEADDVASMVEYLLGEGGRNITGTVLTVDASNTACLPRRQACPFAARRIACPFEWKPVIRNSCSLPRRRIRELGNDRFNQRAFRISSCRSPRLTVGFPADLR